MENQTTIFDMLYSKKKITKPIRLIELFGGYGSQALALKYLGVKFEHWKLVEWAIKSIQAYKDIHCEDVETYSDFMDKETLVDTLYNLGISQNYNEPMKKEQIARLNEKQLRTIYDNIKATHNLVNIQQVKGEDLEIVDTDKYEYIMTYSFPCQDLSLAGKGKGMSDTSTRSGMLWEVERILTECENKPQILLMENVPQIHSEDNLPDFNKWKDRLEELGYKNYFQDLIATDFGIPQTRNRTFMISLLGDYNYTFPKPIPLKLKLKDMLEDNVDEKYYLSDKRLNILTRNVEIKDKKNFIIGSSQKHTCINYDGICPTLTSAMGKGGGQTPMIPVKLQEELIKMLNKYENINDDEILKKGKIKYKIFEKFGTNKKCFRCNSQLLISDLPEYDYLCFECDENMYEFEAINEESLKIKNATSKGYLEATDGDGIDLLQPNSDTRRGRVQKEAIQTIDTMGGNGKGVVCLGGYGKIGSTGQYHLQNRVYDDKIATSITTLFNPYYKSDLKIRKLTPRECGRLMGCKDEDIDKLLSNQSDSSAYHLFGDSIVVNVLMAIFKELI